MMVVEIPVPNGFIKALGLDRPNTISVNCDITGASLARPIAQSTKDKTSTSRTTKPIKRFYIDELGFYRYLDYEQQQYVCSNVSMISSSRRGQQNDNNHSSNGRKWSNKISDGGGGGGGGEIGVEVCFKTVRHDLGISHFDKTEDYANWKRSWDEFMRAKLISQQPVTLNRELKNRVRSGIPHDYRCKVWTALIRMRTRTIRATFGEDIYDVIISDYVSKISIPDYSTEQQQTSTQDSNNNTRASGPIGGNGTGNLHDSTTRQSRHHETTKSSPRKFDPSTTSGRGGSSYISPMTSSERAAYSETAATATATATNSTSTTATLNEGQHTSQRMLAQEPQIDKCFKQIELDLLRTLPNNRHFENPNSIGIKRVRRVLRAYACFNQEVAYCQGMNRLAAMALLVLPEEEAFWCLVAIIQCIMPREYYLKPWLAQVDCCVLGDLLEKKLPKLHKHLVTHDIQLTLFSWFFTIFVDGFRPELMLRIWDCFLLEGDKILFRFALAILHITQDELLKMNDFSTMSSHLSRLVSTRALDVEHLFEAFNTMNPLSTGSLQARREFHRRRMQTMLGEQ